MPAEEPVPTTEAVRRAQAESLREPTHRTARAGRPPSSHVTEVQKCIFNLRMITTVNAIMQNEPNLSVCLQALGFWAAGIKRADFRNHGQRLKGLVVSIGARVADASRVS